MSITMMKARNPPMKLGSSQVETRRLMCGSQPSFSSAVKSGKMISWMKPAMAIKSAAAVIVLSSRDEAGGFFVVSFCKICQVAK